MKELFTKYISSISEKFTYEETSEMGYRTDFEILLKGIFESIDVKRIDHDARAKGGNKPDFVILKNEVPLLYIEAKDIGISLDKIEKSEQMARYFGYANLVLTDYTEFRFYRNGVPYTEPIKIVNFDINTKKIEPISENYEHLAKTILDFTQSHKEPITSGEHLAKIMGGKAQRIRDNVKQFLNSENIENSGILKVYDTIKKLLVHDLTLESFADMYAQTLVYGLFVARFYDESPKDFSREEARDLVPASNPFLRHFFDHIVGPDFDKRFRFIVDELCEVFTHADVRELMNQYFKTDLWGEKHKAPDPVIHFYEDFLKEYDADLRKKMGAFYTPLPVVRFIVVSIDLILKKEFNLSAGLADTAKTEEGVHKVQILDPAVGTGTFISTTIRKIYEKLKEGKQEGRWTSYVYKELLPRLHGFELMMAPYTIAHLKLSMAFKKTGFKYFNNARLGIYLTNSLEKAIDQENLFSSAFGLAESIAEESKEASKIKNEKPIMVVLGNPPYSISSQNKGEWIRSLIKDYKKGLGERKINLDDDYIKFIRFAEHFIEKNKTGVVAMITNNSFIDGITHRQMRKHLLETFDQIYILDLHGNTKKKEKAPDGGKDENIFDIQQGVSISIFVRKNENKKEPGKVYHTELYGKRQNKFKFLEENNLDEINWQKLNYTEPYYFFVPKDFEKIKEYEEGFKIDELFYHYNSGIQTKNDKLSVHFEEQNLEKILRDFEELSENKLKTKYDLKDTSGWNIKKAKESLLEKYYKIDLLYKPFDVRKTVLQEKSTGFIGRSRFNTSKNFLYDNIGLLSCRNQFFNTIAFVTDKVSDLRTYSNPGSLGTDYVFPLYLYEEDGSKIPNLNKGMVKNIEEIVGKTTPEDVFDYIYAVLYSSNYREKYKEFLKIDFPRVQYPKNKKEFDDLVELGYKLRNIHLLKSSKVNNFITAFNVPGSDEVEKIIYKNGNVYINEEQYFGDVSEVTWNFYIGGYKPAQKWLKDRKGRKLTNEDIEHYQKIIVALTETNQIMSEINKILGNRL